MLVKDVSRSWWERGSYGSKSPKHFAKLIASGLNTTKKITVNLRVCMYFVHACTINAHSKIFLSKIL